MDWWLQAAIITGMFVLRLGIPLAVILVVGYFLRRLDAKWQAEAQARWEAAQAQPKPAASPGVDRLNQPCWVVKGCDEATRARCPAAQQPSLPCWLVRYRADGRLPSACYGCELFYRQASSHWVH